MSFFGKSKQEQESALEQYNQSIQAHQDHVSGLSRDENGQWIDEDGLAGELWEETNQTWQSYRESKPFWRRN